MPLRKNLRILQGKVAKVIGIDVDQDAQNNPFIDEFHLIEGHPWPIDSNSINLIVCDNVLEHIENPDQFFTEIHRVLKMVVFCVDLRCYSFPKTTLACTITCTI